VLSDARLDEVLQRGRRLLGRLRRRTHRPLKVQVNLQCTVQWPPACAMTNALTLTVGRELNSILMLLTHFELSGTFSCGQLHMPRLGEFRDTSPHERFQGET
jgi:hypothetical protein